MRWLAIALLFTCALCYPAAAHEITFSHVDVRLGSETRVSVRLPVTALLHEGATALPVGAIEQLQKPEPLTHEMQVILARLLASRLSVASAGVFLQLSVVDTELSGDDIRMTMSGPPIRGTLELHANLFPEDPLHKVFVNVYRAGELAGQYALDRQNSVFTLAAPERPLKDVIITFVIEGIHHIFIGFDHILFVLSLLLLGGTLWSQIRIVTAFTIAHSLTLALATLGVVQLPSRLVESAIALSIVVVGLHNGVQLQRNAEVPANHDPRVLIAFAFGLIHGFGFASVLAELELPKNALIWSLAAFNVGVEIGQVSIVLLAAPILAALRQSVSPGMLRRQKSMIACGIMLAGGYWLIQRALVS